MVLLGRKTLSINGLADCLMLTESNWFIKSYICLYILAPILNAFTDTISQKLFRNTLLAFYIFQSVYGWLSHGAVFLVHGYSAMSFVGLYLLARYIRVYGSKCLNYPPPLLSGRLFCYFSEFKYIQLYFYSFGGRYS